MVGWFRRGPESPFPEDMLQRLDRLGRCKMDMTGSGIDWSEVLRNCIAPFYEQADADPERFLADLLAVVEQDGGGFATYGATTLVHELALGSARSAAGKALLDLAVEFKRKRDLPPIHWTGIEFRHWSEKRQS